MDWNGQHYWLITISGNAEHQLQSGIKNGLNIDSLKGPLMTLDRKLKKKLLAQKRLLEKEKQQTASWLEQYLPSISLPKLLTKHNKISTQTTQELADLVVTAHAQVDAAFRCNTFFAQKTDGDEAPFVLSVKEIANLENNLLRIQVCKLFLRKANLSFPIKELIFRRYISRLFPTLDDTANIQLGPKEKSPNLPLAGKLSDLEKKLENIITKGE